jgi:2-polyprenyl-3-methyl-5-hydroxy-6-metoxy-1,4-benzoquinol methylase
MLKQAKCNLCGSGSYSIVYKTYSGDLTNEIKEYKITDHGIVPLRIVKCKRCGLVYANPAPPENKLLDSYMDMVDELYIEEEEGRRLSAKSILNVLRKFKKRGRILDVGCATGFLLDEARKDGWEPYGVELSKWAVEYAKRKFNLENIFLGSLKEAQYPDNYFDVVVMKDSIEHLTDPKEMLIAIRHVLKSDGILCVNTPNINSLVSKILKAKWWGVNQAHLYYFTRKTLCKMLSITGFVPVKTKSHARTFSLKYWIAKIQTYNKTLYRIFMFLIERSIIRNNLFSINLGDQVEIYARKARKLKYLEELESLPSVAVKKDMKVVVVLPAYNAAKTIKKTVDDIPKDSVNEIILVDDASSDNTVQLAKQLGLKVFTHKKNRGYGGNQKTCYTKALEDGADIVVMVHPDYQYDPVVIPKLIEPIREGKADAVFGSRMMKGGALVGGMPLWKHNANILLTAIENVVFGTFLTEYHSGFRAYSARLLRTVNFNQNSEGFIFDTEIIAQLLVQNYKIEEIPIKTRYFDEASSIKLWPSIVYGLGILKTICKYMIHTKTPFKVKQFLQQ